MKKIITLLVCLSFLTLASCSSASESSVSEESVKSETTTAATTETATEKETTEIKETTAAIPLELNDTFYGNYFSIDVSSGWKMYRNSGHTRNYDVIYQVPDNGSIAITLYSSECSSYDDFYNSFFEESKDTILENTKNVKLLHRKKNDGYNRIVNRFFIYSNSYVSSIEFSYGFPEHNMNLIINSISYTDSLSDVALEVEETTTKKITEKPTEPSTKPQTEPIITKQNLSVGQENALKKAKRYIETMPMSFDGLVEQLEYEGFSSEESHYGAENCGADWNEQAIKKAKSYIDLSGFSYSNLIEQLEYEKFTHDQATYGADNCGADWNAEAAESAKRYMDMMSMSREQLIDQLLYEGYTNEQAEYGASSVGY